MTYREIRQAARDNLQGNYWLSVLVAFVAALLGAIITGGTIFRVDFDTEVLHQLPRFIVRYLAIMGSISGFFALVQLIIGGTVQLGYAKYLLKQHDHASFDIHDLFSQFDRFKEGFLQSFLRELYIFLWSFLLIIPGIVKSYAYAMTPFIMAENPDMSAKEAIEASKQLMHGHKDELFTLDLTFFGWGLLAALTLNIGYIFLNPYKNAAYAVFYKELTASNNQP